MNQVQINVFISYEPINDSPVIHHLYAITQTKIFGQKEYLD